MKIEVLLTAPYPQGNVTTNRVHYLCRGLAEEGAVVDVTVMHPTEKPDAVKNSTAGTHKNVCYRYILSRNVRQRNILVRKLSDFYCHLAVLGRVLFNAAGNDFYIVIGPSFDFRILLPVATFFTRTKIVLEINEYPLVLKKNNWVNQAKRWFFFNRVLPLYDGFIVISDALLNLMMRYKKETAGIVNIPILGSDEVCHETAPKPMIDVPYIIHSGSLSEDKDGVIGILRAYQKAKERIQNSLNFVITGNAANDVASQPVMDFIKNNELETAVVFTGFLSSEALENYLRGSALAIINKYENLQNQYCFPTKLADYLRCGVPIIATPVGELKVYLKNDENALLVSPGDTEQLTEKILEALQDTEATRRRVQNGYALIRREFNYKHQGRILHAFLKKILDSKIDV